MLNLCAGAGSSISGASFPFRSETTDTKPSLKPRPGKKKMYILEKTSFGKR